MGTSSPLPTLAGFLAWVYGTMGVPTAWLPSTEPVIEQAYNVALATVHPVFIGVPGPIYQLMVYNLGGHLLATWAPDVTTRPPYPYKVIDGQEYGFWQWLRKQNNMLGFVTGTVSASSDESTSMSLTVPKQAENLTIGQLQLTTSTWGRQYLGWAQSYGPAGGIS